MLPVTLVISSTIVIEAILAERDMGLRSTTITVLPILTNASHRSPSSKGTNTTSLERIPLLQQSARGPSSPGIFASGFTPRISVVMLCCCFSCSRYLRIDAIRSSVR